MCCTVPAGQRTGARGRRRTDAEGANTQKARNLLMAMMVAGAFY